MRGKERKYTERKGESGIEGCIVRSEREIILREKVRVGDRERERGRERKREIEAHRGT